jgi:hypothetical protein
MELAILEAEKVVISVSYSQQHRLVDGCQYWQDSYISAWLSTPHILCFGK